MGPQLRQPAQYADPPLDAGSTGKWVLRRWPPFLEPRGDLHHPAVGISPPSAAPHPQQVCAGGGGLAAHMGGMGMEARAGKAPIPHPRTNWGWGFHAGQNSYGPALMRGSHSELCFLHWEERGWVKLQRSGRKSECIPQWECIFLGGGCDPGQEALYQGAVEGLTITRFIKPLARSAPATSSTRAPMGAPQGTSPSAPAHFRTALGAMGTVGPEPDFEVCAFIIFSYFVHNSAFIIQRPCTARL